MGGGKIQVGERRKPSNKRFSEDFLITLHYLWVSLRSWWSWMFAPILTRGQQRCKSVEMPLSCPERVQSGCKGGCQEV